MQRQLLHCSFDGFPTDDLTVPGCSVLQLIQVSGSVLRRVVDGKELQLPHVSNNEGE